MIKNRLEIITADWGNWLLRRIWRFSEKLKHNSSLFGNWFYSSKQATGKLFHVSIDCRRKWTEFGVTFPSGEKGLGEELCCAQLEEINYFEIDLNDECLLNNFNWYLGIFLQKVLWKWIEKIKDNCTVEFCVLMFGILKFSSCVMRLVVICCFQQDEV